MSNDNYVNQIVSQLQAGIPEQQIYNNLIASGISNDAAINLLNNAKYLMSSIQNSSPQGSSGQFNSNFQNSVPNMQYSGQPGPSPVNFMSPNLQPNNHIPNNINYPLESMSSNTAGGFGMNMLIVGLLIFGVLLSFVSYLGLAFPNLDLNGFELSKFFWLVGVLSLVLFIIPSAILLFVNKNKISNFLVVVISVFLSMFLVLANTGAGAFLSFRDSSAQNQENNTNLSKNDDEKTQKEKKDDQKSNPSPTNTPKKTPTFTPTPTPTARLTPTRTAPIPTQGPDYQEYLNYLENNTYRYTNTQNRFSLRILNTLRKVSTDNTDPNNYSETFGSSDGNTSLSIIYGKNQNNSNDFRNVYSLLNDIEDSIKSSNKNLGVTCNVQDVKVEYVVCQYVTTLPNGKYAYVVQTVIPDQRDYSGIVVLTGLFLIQNPEAAENLFNEEKFALFIISIGVYSAYTIEFN